jgi:hypothetical protein
MPSVGDACRGGEGPPATMHQPSIREFEIRVGAFNKLAGQLCDTRWQIYFSSVTAIFACYAHVLVTGGNHLPFDNSSTFQTFLFGIGSICAIIAPIMFGFLLQQSARASSEKNALFHRYQDFVIELRNYLRELHDSKNVTNGYLEFLDSLEITKSSDLDGPPDAYYWWLWAAMGLIRWMEDEAASERADVDFDEVHHGLMPRLYVIEELLGTLQVNAIRRAILDIVIISPVINLFWMIAIVIFLALLSTVYYDGIAPLVYYYGVAFVSAFMILTLFQLGRYARYETREIKSERSSPD